MPPMGFSECSDGVGADSCPDGLQNAMPNDMADVTIEARTADNTTMPFVLSSSDRHQLQKAMAHSNIGGGAVGRAPGNATASNYDQWWKR